MNTCLHPNNVKIREKNCTKYKKYNICYGDDGELKNIKDLKNYISTIEKDSSKYNELRDIYTPGCWENLNNKPFIKDWKKKNENHPIKCMEKGLKWITGDGYILTQKLGNISNLNKNTGEKINVECSPGYEGKPSISIGGCKDYTNFKKGDKGNYSQFNLYGCNRCDNEYVGNNLDINDKTCYPKCGSMGTKYFDNVNSNENYKFIDTASSIIKGEERKGYCCKNVSKANTLKKRDNNELVNKGSNIYKCNVEKCEDGFIKDENKEYCCKIIKNSNKNLEYTCGSDPYKTLPKNDNINFCNDGFYPVMNKTGRYSCNKCPIPNNVHDQAIIKCNKDGGNITIDSKSKYKCKSDGISYYDKNTMTCKKCPKNMRLNNKKSLFGKKCVCKKAFKKGNECLKCNGDGIKYNDDFPRNSKSRCKCFIEKTKLPDYSLIGTCRKGLENGETCELKCKKGFEPKGGPVKCYDNYINYGEFKCIPSEETVKTLSKIKNLTNTLKNDVREGFKNRNKGFSSIFPNNPTNIRRIFLILLLLYLLITVIFKKV